MNSLLTSRISMQLGLFLLSFGCTKDNPTPCAEGFVRNEQGVCVEQSSDDTSSAEPQDSGSGNDSGTQPDVTHPGWTWTEVPVCESPAATVQYEDQSAAIGATTKWALPERVQYGIVGITPSSTGSWFAAWHEPANFKWSALDGSSSGTYVSHTNARFTMADVDADGLQDLVVFSATVEIVWDFIGDSPTSSVYWDSETLGVEGRECGWLELAVGDVNGDGLPDLIAPNGFSCSEPAKPEVAIQTSPRVFDEVIVSDEVSAVGAGFDLTLLDLDGDLDLDAYFCNDFGPEIEPNQWALNDGEGAFVIGDHHGSGVRTLCMGTSFGDLNSDGRLDIMVAATGQQYGLLQTDAGFVDHWTSWGIPMQTGEEQMPWGSAVVDLDNNGHSDIILSSSGFSFQEDLDGEPLRAWMQTDSGVFEEQGEALGLPLNGNTRGVVARDLNADGILDLLVGDYTRSPWLLLSESCTANNWVEIEAPNGTVVEIHAGEQRWSALVSNHQGFGGFGPVTAHIGLGEVSTIDRVVAQVPWVGTVEIVEPVAAPVRLRWHQAE